MGLSNPLGAIGRVLHDLVILLGCLAFCIAATYGITELALTAFDQVWAFLLHHAPDWAKGTQLTTHQLEHVFSETFQAPASWVGWLVLAILFAVVWFFYRTSMLGEWLVCTSLQGVSWIIFFWLLRSAALYFEQDFRNWISPIISLYAEAINDIGSASGDIAESVRSLGLLSYLIWLCAFLIGVWILASILDITYRFNLFAMDQLGKVQRALQSILVGSVYEGLPRQPLAAAMKVRNSRREAIELFLSTGSPPPVRREIRFTGSHTKETEEFVIRREETVEAPQQSVNAFLERPPKSPISLHHSGAIELGPEEAVGQFLRLKLELDPGSPRSWWARLWSHERYEDIILPLLGRVVDAAELADRFMDEQRRETDWNALPFYERIWAEYRSLPFPLNCLLRPLLGNSLPIRVVVETEHKEMFLAALFGGTPPHSRAAVHKDWFGVGIQIEKPNQSQTFAGRLWRRYARTEVAVTTDRSSPPNAFVATQCRRLKSHVKGALGPELQVRFTNLQSPGANWERGDPPRNGYPPIAGGEQVPIPTAGQDRYYLMPTRCVADGCPSVARPLNFPTNAREMRFSSPERANPTPLPRRGTVSNQPPVTLIPANTGRLFRDCQNVCLRSKGTETHELEVTSAPIDERVQQAISNIPRRYSTADGSWLYRRVWIGAFFDNEVRVAFRFPLFGCTHTYGKYNLIPFRAKDLSGAVARPIYVYPPSRNNSLAAPHDEARFRKFGGVFVSCAGPQHAANLLLAEPILHDYFRLLAKRDDVLAVMAKSPHHGEPRVPRPHDLGTRSR